MASLLFNSFIDDLARGAIDADTDTFKVMLVTSTYAPNKDTHTKRSDVTNEVVGTGYTAGGVTSAATVTKNTATDQVTIAFASVNWPTGVRKTLAAAATVQDTDFEETLDMTDGVDHPIVLAQNEGIVVRNGILMGAGGTVRMAVQIAWDEVAAY